MQRESISGVWAYCKLGNTTRVLHQRESTGGVGLVGGDTAHCTIHMSTWSMPGLWRTSHRYLPPAHAPAKASRPPSRGLVFRREHNLTPRLQLEAARFDNPHHRLSVSACHGRCLGRVVATPVPAVSVLLLCGGGAFWLGFPPQGSRCLVSRLPPCEQATARNLRRRSVLDCCAMATTSAVALFKCQGHVEKTPSLQLPLYFPGSRASALPQTGSKA